MNIRKIYVSDVDGDDSWTGAEPDSNTSGTGPFKTLQYARDVASSTDITNHIQIIIREGTYTFTTPFILTSSNSGSTPFTPLTFQAYDNEIVKLCAATTLDSTLFSLVTDASDSAIYNRLNTLAKGKVYVYNLGVGFDVGKFTTYWNGVWLNQADQLTNTHNEYLLSSKYNKGSDLPPLPEISIDGELLTLARWPSTGYAEMKSVVEAGSVGGDDCDCVGDATTTCVGKTPCYDSTSDLCNYKYYTGTNSYLNNRIPKIPWGIDGIFEYDSSYDSIIAKWPNPSTYEMYIYGPVSFDFSAEGMKILEINKTNRTIKVNSHRSRYGIIQFNDACYGRAYSTTGLNCNCPNSSGVETIPVYTQPVYDSPTCVATSSKQESNDNLATRKLSSSPQRWRRDYWSDPHPRRWFALNILEELNSAGQYYIDRATKKLYVWSKTPITSSSKVLISKVSGYGSDNTQTAYESDRSQSVIKITGASNIKFENIEICDTSGHGIDIIRSNNITLKNCNIYNTRKTGIRILGGTSNNVDGCNIFDTGTGGVRLSGGNKITLEPSKHIIQNCDITRTCLNIRGETMVAAIQMHGVGNTIRKNKIYNLSSQAIGHSGNNNIIEYNNIHDVILECDDCGAIYTWANISNRGNICRYNLFRNIQNKLRAVTQFPSANANSCNSNPTSVDPNGDSNAMKDGWFGHCAIYFDNFAGGMTITGNIFYRCGNKNGKGSMGAIFTNYGIDVIASNNIFVDCPLAVGSNPNRAYYATDTTATINDRQISTGGNESWEVALNDKPIQYNDSNAAPCCRTPTPGNFNGWSVLLNWNGITLGTANDVAFIQNPKLFEYNYKELGYITQCDIRSTVYTNQYPELLGSKSDTPTSFLYFDTVSQLLKVNPNYPRKNYANTNVFVQTPYKTSTYSSWNQVIKTWDTTNDQVITKIEEASFVDIANGDFRLNSDSPINLPGFKRIPVESIAGFYDDIQSAQEVVLDFTKIPLYFERMDGVSTWPGSTAVDSVGIPSESKYLKSNLETRKYVMLNHMGFWDSTNTRTTPIDYHTDPVGAINQLKAADLTNTIKNQLIMLAQIYNTYITNLNNDTVGGTKPITEHMGEIPLIVFDYEAPMIGLILDVANTRAGIDATYGTGTWQKAIDFLSAMIPEAKRLLADSSFRSANKIPSLFTKAKFSHYSMPHAVTNVSLNGKAYALNTTSERRAIRTKLIGSEYFGKIIESCDFFVPAVYAYWPMSSTNPGGCSGSMTTNNIYGRNFQKQTIYDNVILFNEWMSATGTVKDIYPILSHAYVGDYWDYFWYYNCTNIAFDPTNITKQFWGSRRITDEDAVETMKIAVDAGKTAVKGFLYWSSSYTTGPTYRLTSPCSTTRLKARAVYAKDINNALIPYINVDSYWPTFTTGSCVESFTSNVETSGTSIGNNSPSINPTVAATVSATGSGGLIKIVKNIFISDQVSNQTDPVDSIVLTMSNLKIELIKSNNQHVDIIRDASPVEIVASSTECCFEPCTCSSAGDFNKCCWNNQTCINNYCSKSCYGGTGALPESCCKCRKYYTDFKVASGDAVEVIASGCVYPISDKNINYVDGVYTSGIPVTTQNPNGGYPDNGWVKCIKANGDFVLRPWINGDVKCGCLSGETMFDDSANASPLYGSVSIYLPNGIGGWSSTPTQVFIASSLLNNDTNKHDVGGIFESDDLCALTGFLNKNGFDEYAWCNSQDYPTCFVPQALTLQEKSHSHFCYSSCDCSTGTSPIGHAGPCDSSCTTWVYSSGANQYFCDTLSYSDCMTWSICKERGCCVQCPSSCTPANCTDYYNCSALTGKYASGGLCDATAGKSCSGLCGTNNFCTSASSGRCSRVSKPDWDTCMTTYNSSNPSTGGCLCKNCCGLDPCSTYARTGKPGDSTYWDYWRCESDPTCKASKCITKDCTKDCPVDPCNVAQVTLPFKYPRGMAVANGKIYVAGATVVGTVQTPSVTIIDLSTRKIIKTLIGTGSWGLVAIVYRPSTNRIYAVGTGGSMCINPSLDVIDSTVSLGSGVRLIHDVSTDYLIGLRSNFRESVPGTQGNTLFKVDFSNNVTAGPTNTFSDIDNLMYIPQEGGYISVNGTGVGGGAPAISRITWNGTSYSAAGPTFSTNTQGFSVYATNVNRLYTGSYNTFGVSNITITKSALIGVTNFSGSIASTTRLTSATYSRSTNKIYVSAFGKIAIITPNTAYNASDFTTSLSTNVNSFDIFYDSVTDRVYFTGTDTTSNSTPYLKIINPYTQQLDDMVSGSTYYPAGCNTGTDNCCTCAAASCSTNTQSAYATCLASCPTVALCCVNPCLCADGSTAASKIASSSNKVSAYTDCMNKANAFSAIKDTSCCGGFNCSYCNFSAGSPDLTDILCVNAANKENDCYVCNNSACDDSTSTQYANCIKTTGGCPDKSCCVDPCVGKPTITTVAQYKACLANATYGPSGADCCGSFQCSYCNFSAGSPDLTDILCVNAANKENDCYTCNNSLCDDSTSTQYANCIKTTGGCPDKSCCINPCIGAPTNYFNCISNTTVDPIYGNKYVDRLCCASAPTCADCGADPCIHPDSRCSNATDKGGCCKCKDNRCKDSTSTEYITCNSNIAFCGACCVDPCIGKPTITTVTDYKACLANPTYGPSGADCCGSFQCSYCNFSAGSPDLTDSLCVKPGDKENDCYVCNNSACDDSTSTQYANCIKTTGGCPDKSCCVDPCIGKPTITTVADYKACIAGSYGPSGADCCGSFQCSYCNFSAGSPDLTDILCVNAANKENDCYRCNDTICSDSTPAEYIICNNNIAFCGTCCVDPCLGMPAVDTIEKWRKCELSKTGTINEYTQFTSAQCSCGDFNCSLCGVGICNPDILCQSIACCACKNPSCKTAKKIEYDFCKLNKTCTDSGCCINPCIGVPKGYTECMRSPFANLGCCKREAGPCDLCPFCLNGCSTTQLYSQCVNNYTCNKNKCCVDMSPVIPVCDECSTNCNSCFANATCVNNGCCSGFNCSNITCPNTATKDGWDNCMLNGCCKNLGCCGPSPCLTCPSDHRTCIQNKSCNDAGCCGPPQSCDTCANIVDRITCWKTCGADPQLSHCCPGGPCDGCLNPLDGSTWYTCMDNQDCLDLQCCGLAPCITNNCFSRTKPEYISCRNNPNCNPPIQDEAHDCCVDPCVGCSDNYFDCITNPACVSAMCCAPAPTCVDCVGDPCLSTHIECSKATDNGGCCKCKDNKCKDSTKPEYDICNNNINFCGECCVDPCIGAPTNYFDCVASPYVGKLCCSFDCASCGLNPCTSTQGQCSLSPDQGGCCACAFEACSTSNKTEYDLCLRNSLCNSSSCCINPCVGAPTNYFDCINDTTIDSVYGNTYAVRGCCPSVPSCADCGSSPCSHPDPRCSNSSDATGTRGCCNCKSNRCKDSTRSEYLNCKSQYNKLYCNGCCDSPCTGCGQYKTSEYFTCSHTAGCASKGCCNKPPFNPCDGCKTSNCSNDAICVANMCCKSFPPCEFSNCPSEYLQCMATPGCPNSGCCPPNPCHACNTERSVEGYAECITSNELLHCIAYNCCQDPCDVCANMLYSSCMTDVYCLKHGCCPQEPCSMCEEKYDNYEDCTKDPICDLYCCCKDV